MPKVEDQLLEVKIEIAVVPDCQNSALSEGNCKGMIVNGTCPVIAARTKGKFPGCTFFVSETKKDKNFLGIGRRAIIHPEPPSSLI